MMTGMDGPADPSPSEDVVLALRALGIPDAVIARAIERGEPEGAIFEAVLMPAMTERTVAAVDIERRGGLSVSNLQAFISACGLLPPEPQEPAFTAEEADVFVELGRLQDIWPAELDIHLGRVWGPLLARTAQAAMQLFRAHVEPQLHADDPDRLAGLRAVKNAFEQLLPLADPVLLGVYRRWTEHELAQAAVTEAEASTGSQELPGSVSVTFLFCDLKDFTEFVEAEGDAVAVAAIDCFAETVARERGGESLLLKSLGDGVMLAYGHAAPAVAAGARIIERVRTSIPLRAHASVHQGVAIARDGDYFGGAVNLAARLLDTAAPDELVATRSVVARTSDRYTWEPMGMREIRGVAQPVEVFRLV